MQQRFPEAVLRLPGELSNQSGDVILVTCWKSLPDHLRLVLSEPVHDCHHGLVRRTLSQSRRGEQRARQRNNRKQYYLFLEHVYLLSMRLAGPTPINHFTVLLKSLSRWQIAD